MILLSPTDTPEVQSAARLLVSHCDYPVVVFGEVHGTAEFPSIVGALATLCSNRVLILAVEVVSSAQTSVDRYLVSHGTQQDAADLLAHPFWSLRDGRASAGMFQLLETARRLRQSGAPIAVSCFDGVTDARYASRELASSIRHSLKSSSQTYVLIGNAHTRCTLHGSRETSAVDLLADLDPRVFLFEASGGEAWFCSRVKCGVHSIEASDDCREPHPRLLVENLADAHGQYATLKIGRVSASPPARDEFLRWCRHL